MWRCPSASCTTFKKLSGVAPPSCCSGSSQRGAILVCHASTMLLGPTCAAAMSTAHERCRKRGRRDRRPQHGSPAPACLVHPFLSDRGRETGTLARPFGGEHAEGGARCALQIHLPPRPAFRESLASSVSQLCKIVLSNLVRRHGSRRAALCHEGRCEGTQPEDCRMLWWMAGRGSRDRRPDRVCCHGWLAALEPVVREVRT